MLISILINQKVSEASNMFSNMLLDITPVSFHGVLSMACFRGLRGLRYESSEFRTDFA